MPNSRIFLSIALAAAVAAPLAGWALAQEAAPSPDKVIAIVNGHEIKVSEAQMASDDIIGLLPDLPPKARYPFVVNYLIERHLLAQRAVKEGVADTKEYKERLALYQAKALRDAYFFEKIKPMVTEEEIKAAYDLEAARVEQTERVRARHILVNTEKEARDIAAKIEKGEKFEDLAKQYSLDGSKEYGGDLGYFTAPEMVAEFSKAAFALKKGEVSQPVKTDFGWHLIKLEDRKMGGAQPFDQVKGAIRNILVRKKVQQVVDETRRAAKVEILDPDLNKMIEELEKKRPASAEQGGDAAASSGKSDLQIPQ
jgi:peptidyl-prolyl cis-trans isomerase C